MVYQTFLDVWVTFVLYVHDYGTRFECFVTKSMTLLY